MVMHIKLMTLFTLLVSFICGSRVYSEDTTSLSQHVDLEIGESYEISLPEGTGIQLSKRGVVDAQLVLDKIRLVGLRTGFVSLTLSKPQVIGGDYKYFINVKQKTDKDDDAFVQAVKLAGLSISKEKFSIEGISYKYFHFYKVKKLCEEKKYCTFLALLSPSAVQEVLDYLRNILPSSYEIQALSHGPITILEDCSEEKTDSVGKVEHLVGNKDLQKNILVSCKREWRNGYFTVYSKMIVMENSKAKELGLQTNFQLDSENSFVSSRLNLALHAAVNDKKAKLIGEPVIWLTEGVTAHVQSGSEILFRRRDEKKRQEDSLLWKEVGLDLKVKIFPVYGNKVKLYYNFIISSMSQKNGSQIFKNKLESEIELQLEEAAIVGGIQFKASDEHKKIVPYIESIPILGPFFKTRSESECDSTIFLYFYAKRN